MNKILIIILLSLLLNNLFSQEIKQNSAHKYHKEYFDSLKIYCSKEYAEFGKAKKLYKTKKTEECNLEKIVFGWHPYWSGEAYNNLCLSA